MASDYRTDALIELDRQVDTAEDGGIVARWEFGRELAAERVGKQLPKGRLDAIALAIGKKPREIQLRMQCFDTFAVEAEVRNAVAQFRSWHELVKGFRKARTAPDLWDLPRDILSAAERTLDKIELMPSVEDDLDEGWEGTVLMHPPAGFEAQFVERLLSERGTGHVTEAIAVVPPKTDAQWFPPLFDHTLCFPGKVNFTSGTREKPTGVAIVYLGTWKRNFEREFRDIGPILERYHAE